MKRIEDMTPDERAQNLLDAWESHYNTQICCIPYAGVAYVDGPEVQAYIRACERKRRIDSGAPEGGFIGFGRYVT